METKKTIWVALSGGVDSAVTARQIQMTGCTAQGVTMQLLSAAQGVSETALQQSAAGIADARSICERLGIAHRVLDFSDVFRRQVMEAFAAAYERGATPNPCIACNRYLKFGALAKAAAAEGAAAIATGHYARIARQGDRLVLQKAADLQKDQSYVLYHLTQEQLAFVRFPLGTLKKETVRELAAENGFLNARKRDSQDICFVPDGDYVTCIERLTGTVYPPGDFTDKDGRVLGTHRGIVRYTVGQRRGLGLALPQSMYVVQKDAARNRVVLGYAPDLLSNTVTVRDLCLSACDRLDTPTRLSAKIRYNQTEQPATVVQTDADTLQIVFDTPQRAVTSGQAAVLYDGDTVVGGGTIV